MDKVPAKLACLGLMVGSGAAWSAVQAGDGATRPQSDALAKLARDSVNLDQIAAAAASSISTPAADTASAHTHAPIASASNTHAHVPDGTTHGARSYIAPDAIAIDLPVSAPSVDEAVAAQLTAISMSAHSRSTQHVAPDVIALQFTEHGISTESAPAVRATDAAQPELAATDSSEPAQPVASHPHASAHARLAAARLSAPPSPNVIASLGAVSVAGTDDSVSSEPSTQAAVQKQIAATRPAQGIAGIAIEPAGAVIAKAMPLDPVDTRNDPISPRTNDRLPLAPASAAASRSAWTLSTPAPLASNGKDDTAPRAPTEGGDASKNWTEMKVSDARLDEMRGGFDIATGLQIAFGIERAVFVNGQLVATTSFNIPNLAQITVPQAQQLAQALNTATVVQTGAGNIAPANLMPGASAATIIQNTLNNQSIKALTTVNAAVNTLAQFKASNVQSTINSAIANTNLPR